MPNKSQKSASSPNIINLEDIDQFLRGLSGNSDQIYTFLKVLFEKPLKETSIFAEKINELPQNAPKWLVKKWNKGEKNIFHRFNPYSNPKKVHFIWKAANWIEDSIKNKADWLEKTNEKGIPEVLLGHKNLDSCQELLRKYELGAPDQADKASQAAKSGDTRSEDTRSKDSKAKDAPLTTQKLIADIIQAHENKHQFCPSDSPIIFNDLDLSHASSGSIDKSADIAFKRQNCGTKCALINGKLSALETPECFTQGVRKIFD